METETSVGKLNCLFSLQLSLGHVPGRLVEWSCHTETGIKDAKSFFKALSHVPHSLHTHQNNNFTWQTADSPAYTIQWRVLIDWELLDRESFDRFTTKPPNDTAALKLSRRKKTSAVRTVERTKRLKHTMMLLSTEHLRNIKHKWTHITNTKLLLT